MADAWARRSALLAFGVVVIVAAVSWWLPFITDKHQVLDSTPSPPGIFGSTVVTAQSGQSLCWSKLPLDADAQVLGFVPVTNAGPAPPLRLRLAAPGYVFRMRVPGGYADRQVLQIPLRGTPPAANATLCVTPLGHALGFLATNEGRTLSRPDIAVGGKPIPNVDAVVQFAERQPRSLLQLPGTIATHAKVVSAPLFPRWLIWLLVVLPVLAVPALVAGAIDRALRPAGASAGWTARLRARRRRGSRRSSGRA
jgi:hypothetical protein